MAPNARATMTKSRSVLSGPQDILSLIGGTSLLRFNRITRQFPNVEIYAKAEWENPGGSVKDRPAKNIILEAERAGLMNPERILIDSTSGNTGIAYAMICAARGYRLKICMPSNVSTERKQILAAYGAEIIEQTDGRVTHFVAGLGTSGTFVGTSRRLKELKPSIRCISFQPDSAFHGLEGLKHMETAILPGIYDPTLADDDLAISTEEAYAMTLRLAREEGLLVGVSAGAAMVAAMKVAATLDEGVIVTVFSDSGDKYLSERFWTERIK